MPPKRSGDPMSDGYWLEVQDKRVTELEEAIRKLAGLVIADAEAMDRGYLTYDVEYEGIVRDRASAAKRVLAGLELDAPPSPYSDETNRTDGASGRDAGSVGDQLSERQADA